MRTINKNDNCVIFLMKVTIFNVMIISILKKILNIKMFILQQIQETSSPVKQVMLRPPMKDKEVWTHEPEHDCFLHVRVYKPEGLDGRELKCLLTYGQQMQKTKILDPMPPVIFDIFLLNNICVYFLFRVIGDTDR